MKYFKDSERRYQNMALSTSLQKNKEVAVCESE